MSKRASTTAIGGFVLGAMLLLVASVLAFSSGQLFRESISLVTYFEGSAQGLSVGAPLVYRGVKIGAVTDIKIIYTGISEEPLVPVYMTFWPDTVEFPGKADTESDDNIERLTRERGLRTRLEATSLVTGQFNVALDFYPGSPAKFVGRDTTGAAEIPSVQSTRDKISDALDKLDLPTLANKAVGTLDALQNLIGNPELEVIISDTRYAIEDLRAGVGDTRRLVKDLESRIDPLSVRLDATLVEYHGLASDVRQRVGPTADDISAALESVRKLVGHVDVKVDPIASAMVRSFEQGEVAFTELEELVSQDSATRQDLDSLLQEAAGAARSLRILADYIERNPDALIRGKY